MSTKLARKPLVAADPIDEGIKTLAAEAKLLFNYTLLQNSIGEDNQSRKAVVEAFTELGIKPFSTEAVEKYKKSVVFWHTIKDPGHIADCVGNFFCISMIVCGAIGLLGMFATAWWWNYGGVVFGSILGFAAFSFVAMMVICAIFVEDRYVNGKKTGVIPQWEAKWERVLLHSYSQKIPEFALQTAVDLKKKCPSLIFMVEELRVEKVLKDPFLVVIDEGGNEYYLEVWNEPRFKHG